MKVTKELIGVFVDAVFCGARLSVDLDDDEIGAGLQAVLDHLFPEPGTNPLADNLAPHRDSMEINKLRTVLYQADQSELAVRRYVGPRVFLGPNDPEREQILATLVNVRRMLTPWARDGWHSVNGDGR